MAVAPAGERRRPGALELNIAPGTIPANDLAQQGGASIPELRHETTELMPRIGERNGFRPCRNAVAGQDLHYCRTAQLLGVEPKLLGERGIDPDKPERCDGCRIDVRIEARRQAGVAVVEWEMNEHAVSFWSRRRCVQQRRKGGRSEIDPHAFQNKARNGYARGGTGKCGLAA